MKGKIIIVCFLTIAIQSDISHVTAHSTHLPKTFRARETTLRERCSSSNSFELENVENFTVCKYWTSRFMQQNQ